MISKRCNKLYIVGVSLHEMQWLLVSIDILVKHCNNWLTCFSNVIMTPCKDSLIQLFLVSQICWIIYWGHHFILDAGLIDYRCFIKPFIIYLLWLFLLILPLFKDLPDISTRSTLSFHLQELLHISNLIFQEQLKIGMNYLAISLNQQSTIIYNIIN